MTWELAGTALLDRQDEDVEMTRYLAEHGVFEAWDRAHVAVESGDLSEMKTPDQVRVWLKGLCG